MLVEKLAASISIPWMAPLDPGSASTMKLPPQACPPVPGAWCAVRSTDAAMPVNCCALVLVVKLTLEPGGRSARVGRESSNRVVTLPIDAERIVSLAGSTPATDVLNVLRVCTEPIAGVELMLLIAGLLSTVIVLLPAGASSVVTRGGLT